MKIKCFFLFHQWEYTNHVLSGVETRRCIKCGKQQHYSGSWLEGCWREH